MPSPQQLEDALRQPLVRLSDPASATGSNAQDAINELLVPVELLREALAEQDTALEQPAIAAYLPRAYGALLLAAGTSYDEIRFARTADDPTRQSLADRLSIVLRGPDGATPRPDQLDQLNISPEALTETDLENLFGMPQTTPGLDRLRTLPRPQMLAWQLSAQLAGWSTEESADFPGRAFTVIIDPDVITDQDIQPGGAATQNLTAILQRRAAELTAIQVAVSNAVQATRDPAGQFTGALAAAQSGFTGADLDTWQSTETTGNSIASALRSAGLDRPGYQWLSIIRQLTANGLPATPDEWTTTTAVLVGAYRRRAYPKWKSEEIGLVLNPDQFAAAASGPDRPAFRISAQARADWLSVLATRTLQRDSLLASAAGVVSAAHRATLPALRDDLLQTLARKTNLDVTALGDTLTRQLFVDVLASGSLTTTRLAQATASLQTLLQLVRAEDVPADAREAGWALQSGTASFDNGWTWLSSAGTWRQAVTGFLFPEAHLPPDQVTDKSGGFAALKIALQVVNKTTDPSTIADDVSAYVAKLVPKLNAAGVQVPDSFLWLSDRDPNHQKQLADWSRQTHDADPDLALEVFWAAPALLAQTLMATGHPQLALDWLWVLYPYNSPSTVSGFHVINTERDTDPAAPDLTMGPGWTDTLDPLQLVAGRPAPFLRGTLLTIASALLSYGDSEFATEDAASIALATNLYQSTQRVLAHPRLAPLIPQNPDEAALPIPLLQTLRLRAANQLAKIRQGRNIAGLPRSVPPPSDTAAGQPISQPTPYLYSTLIARAQQQAQQAMQFEAQYLSLLERFDAATLKLDDARFAAGLADLQDTAAGDRVIEANDAQAAADTQVRKASTMVQTYQDQITNNETPQETALLTDYSDMRDLQDAVAGFDALIAGA
jgi:hypothetical protein